MPLDGMLSVNILGYLAPMNYEQSKYTTEPSRFPQAHLSIPDFPCQDARIILASCSAMA